MHGPPLLAHPCLGRSVVGLSGPSSTLFGDAPRPSAPRRAMLIQSHHQHTDLPVLVLRVISSLARCRLFSRCRTICRNRTRSSPRRSPSCSTPSAPSSTTTSTNWNSTPGSVQVSIDELEPLGEAGLRGMDPVCRPRDGEGGRAHPSEGLAPMRRSTPHAPLSLTAILLPCCSLR